MLLLVIVTLGLIALRLLGDSSTAYKTVSMTWFGGLVGYSVGVTNWIVIASAVLLALGEGYAALAGLLPVISPTSLIGLVKSIFASPKK